MTNAPHLPDASLLIVRAEDHAGLTRVAEAIHVLYRDADVQFHGETVRSMVGGMHADLLWSLILPALRGFNVERVLDEQVQLQRSSPNA